MSEKHEAIVGPNLQVTWFEEAAELDDIPDFLLVKNRVPLTAAQRAKLAAIKVEHPSDDDKWARNRRRYEAEGERLKMLKAEADKPRLAALAAKSAAERAEIKAVKDAAKAAHRK
jgi:hypothetical protein